MPTLRSNTTMTSPDAATEDAREAIRIVEIRLGQIRELSGMIYFGDLHHVAREAVASLEDAGFEIRRATPDAGGAVTISVPDAKVLREICRRTRNKGDQLAAAYYVKWFDQAIAARGGRHDGE